MVSARHYSTEYVVKGEEAMLSSNQVRVRLSELRTAAENLTTAADRIDSAVSTTNALVDGLMARGFVSPAATVFHSRYLNNVTWMDEWPVHVRDFAEKLREAADEIEAAVGDGGNVETPVDTGSPGNSGHSDGGSPPPYVPPPPIPGTSGTGTSRHSSSSSSSGTSGTSSTGGSGSRRQRQDSSSSSSSSEPEAPPEQAPLQAYMSGVNRPLYDQITQAQAEIGTEQQNLDLLQRRRMQIQEQIDDLTHRLEQAGANTSNARLDAMHAELARVDEQIAASQGRIDDLNAGIADIQARLERVRPGAGADLELIASLEGSRTIDAILNATRQADNSVNCVNWVCSRMPIPPGIPGNAMTWIDNAAAHPEYGITVGTTPLPGSVIVMQPEHSFAHDVFGHVMYVERVENGQIWVTDNFHHEPVLLNNLTDELTGPYIQYMYFPWQTQA